MLLKAKDWSRFHLSGNTLDHISRAISSAWGSLRDSVRPILLYDAPAVADHRPDSGRKRSAQEQRALHRRLVIRLDRRETQLPVERDCLGHERQGVEPHLAIPDARSLPQDGVNHRPAEAQAPPLR